MSLINARAGRVHIRVGGNTQDFATLVDSLPDGKAIEKDKENAVNPVRRLIFPARNAAVEVTTHRRKRRSFSSHRKLYTC